MRILSIFLFGVWLAGCSGAAPVQSRGVTSHSPTGATAGSASATGVGFGSSSPVGLQAPGGAGAGGTAPSSTPMGGTTTSVPLPIKLHEPLAIDQTGPSNPAGLAAADVAKLKAGGPVGTSAILYPYEGTVFPRGLLPPQIMWEGGETDAVYVRIKSQSFEYSSVLKPTVDEMTMQPQLTLPEDVWAKAGEQTNGKLDPFTLELSTRAGGAVVGPMTVHFLIAQATVKGSIYYNTYASKLPGAAIGGNVLRIPAGGKVELFNSLECNGCHSVAANGSKMLSQIGGTGGKSYSLVSGGPANPSGTKAGARVSFGALYPDGSKYLSTTTMIKVAHAEQAEPANTPTGAALFDTATGEIVPDTGISASAAMPMFSPDGQHLAFTDAAVDGGDAIAVMDYDVKAHKATKYRVLMRDTAETRPGWPFFLPDSKAIIFTRTMSKEYSGDGAYVGAGSFSILAGPFAGLASAPFPGPNADLYIADLATGTVTLLAQAMGFRTPADAASDRTYLPFADDVHQAYFPTVSPVAAGGYFWVFFDTIRHYGNLGSQRQLWGFAIDIQADGAYTKDLSHPAFYLPGQEFGAGNHRAFAALDPCKSDGASCTSGIDCCGGACNIPASQSEFGGTGTCGPITNSCAKRDERCTTDADCCPPGPSEAQNSCIAGFCAFISLN